MAKFKSQKPREAYILVKGYVTTTRGRSRFVTFQRDARVVALVRKTTKKDFKRSLVFPK